MSAELRHDQECDESGCGRPARFGSLCARCFYAATPARRAVELALESSARHAALMAKSEAALEVKWLHSMFALPAFTAATSRPPP